MSLIFSPIFGKRGIYFILQLWNILKKYDLIIFQTWNIPRKLWTSDLVAQLKSEFLYFINYTRLLFNLYVQGLGLFHDFCSIISSVLSSIFFNNESESCFLLWSYFSGVDAWLRIVISWLWEDYFIFFYVIYLQEDRGL